MAERFSLKDHLFNRETVAWLAGFFERAGLFQARPFVDEAVDGFPALELKQRIAHLSDLLAARLPRDFNDLDAAIRAGLPPELDPTRNDGDFGNFVVAPLGLLVERRGLDHPEAALDLLGQITRRFSMEWSVRPFIEAHKDLALKTFADWTAHDNYHVRRLVSEGTRPRLPWGRKISLDPLETLPLLDRLHGDPSRYVTRSVANHLGDIAKADCAAVLDRLALWRDTAAGGARRAPPGELDWLTRHALRTQVKAGVPEVMEFLGYRPDAPVSGQLILGADRVAIGGRLPLEAEVSAARESPVILDYAIDFVTARGGTAARVFKWKDVIITPEAPLRVRKSHRFKGDATTFSLYPGQHAVRLLANGREIASAGFMLVET